MKINTKIPHGELGHYHDGGCVGYAKGGMVEEDRNAPGLQDSTVSDFLGPLLMGSLGKVAGLAPEAETGISKMMNPDADIKEEIMKSMSEPFKGYAEGGEVKETEESPIIKKLREWTMGSGGSIGADQKETNIAMGVDNSSGTAKNYAEGGQVTAAEEAADGEDENDPSIVPEDIKEFVEQAHKRQRESRPDENWRITPPEKGEHVAPYKENEEADEEEDQTGVPGFAKGGIVDPEALANNLNVSDIAAGGPEALDALSDSMTPEPGPDPKKLADNLNVSDIAAGGPEALDALTSTMPAKTPAPAPTAPPTVPRGTMPAPTEQDFMTKASNMLGLNSGDQATFMKMLGDNAQKGQIGAGIAGIGDAIASGGTLGKVSPGNLQRSEDLIQKAEDRGISGMQTIRGNQKDTTELSLKLQAQDPDSPLSKKVQKMYAGLGKKIGIDLSHASAAMIGDITGKGVQALNDEAELAVRKEGLDIQKGTLAATIANQKAQHENEKEGRQLEANKAYNSRGLLDKTMGLIPGTAANTSKKFLESEIAGTKSGPVKVNSMEEYKALPSGTHYVDSHGTEKVKK